MANCLLDCYRVGFVAYYLWLGVFLNLNKKLIKLSKSGFIRNVAIVATGTAGAQAIAMAFAPVITRLYTPEAFGVLGMFMAILAIASPLTALTYPVAIVLPKADRDAKKLAWLSVSIAIVMVSVTAISLMFGGPWFSELMGFQAVSEFLLLIPLAMLFNAIHQILQQWLIRKKEFSVTARVAVIQSFIINFTKVSLGWLYPYAAVLIIVAAFGGALHGFLSWQGIKRRVRMRPQGALNEEKDNLSYMGWKDIAICHRDFPLYRAPQIAISALSQGLPVLMLAMFFGPAAAGHFALCKSVLAAPSLLIGTSVGNVFYPRAVEAKNNKENIKIILIKSVVALFLIALPVLLPIMIVGPWVFELVFGDGWGGSGRYAQWVAGWILLSLVARPAIALIPVVKLQGFFLLHEILSVIAKGLGLYVGYLLHSDIFAVAAYSMISAISYATLIAYVVFKVARE